MLMTHEISNSHSLESNAFWPGTDVASFCLGPRGSTTHFIKSGIEKCCRIDCLTVRIDVVEKTAIGGHGIRRLEKWLVNSSGNGARTFGDPMNPCVRFRTFFV